MSKKYIGGLITKNPITPTSGFSGTASGIWTLEQAMQYIKAGTWPTVNPDPQFNYVTMLLSGNGTNGAKNATFLDSSTNAATITAVDNMFQGSFSPYGSNWSNYLGGSGNYLTAANNSAFQFVGSDFTVEAWIYVTGGSGGYPIVSHSNYPGAWGSGWAFALDSNRNLVFYNFNNDFDGLTGATVVPLNTWIHVAVSRSGSTVKLWVNGVQDASSTNQPFVNATQNLYIGATISGQNWNATRYFNGYISNLRLVKGTALYTTTFTPSTTPLTAISGTSLLTCQSNCFIDNSSNAFAITINSTPLTTKFSPFSPSSGYTTSAIGGSGMFEGSPYLTVPDSADWDFGTGDFTVECWVYPWDNSSTMMMVSQYNSSNGFSLQWNAGTTLYWYKGGTQLASFSNAIKAFQWNHVVAVRSGTVFRLYVNGVGNTAISDSTNFSGATTPLTIGNISSLYSQPFNGNIGDVRIVKGTAVYNPNSATLTVPTAPLTAITNTKFLCNFTNAGVFDTASMADLNTRNNVQISTTQSKFNGSSIYFNLGAGGGTLLTYNRPYLYQFDTGDFTIEMWVYRTSSGVEQYLYDGRGTSDSNICPAIYINTSNQLIYNVAGTNVITGGTISANTWTFVTVCRSSETTKMYINGTQTGSDYADTNSYISFASCPRIGSKFSYGSGFGGYMQDLRITKGYARYTGNFTAPTQAFPTY